MADRRHRARVAVAGPFPIAKGKTVDAARSPGRGVLHEVKSDARGESSLDQ